MSCLWVGVQNNSNKLSEVLGTRGSVYMMAPMAVKFLLQLISGLTRRLLTLNPKLNPKPKTLNPKPSSR